MNAPSSIAAAPRAPRCLFGGLFLVALSVLLLEVAITRVFAILMWHHFAYLVISLALLGFGASGSILTGWRGDGPRRSTASVAAMFATAYGAAVVLAFLAVTRIRVDSLELWNAPENFFGLLLHFVVLAVPFLCAGLAIGTTLTRHPREVGRLYFTDLVGSAAGGALAPSLLDAVGAPATVMIAGALGLLGGVVYAAGTPPARRLVHALPLVAGVVGAIGFCGGGLGIPPLSWPVPFAPHKDVTKAFPGGVSDQVLPSAVAQVDVSRPKVHSMTIGGQFGDRNWQYAEIRGVTQDGTAPTALYKNASDLAQFPSLGDSQAASGYVAFKARGGVAPEVLVIGCGGGVDVMTALSFGAASVTAVDINRAMIRMVREVYADYIGRLFDDPRVRLEQAEGRSFLRREARDFDLIQLSGVDTFTALSTGAYTLSESYLYTVEAVKDFYRHLKDGGIVTYSRFLMTWPKPARETIRLANIVRQALEELGVAEPWRHVAILQAHGWASTMIRKGPFTEAETTALRRFAEDERFMGLVFDPQRPGGGPYDRGRVSNLHCQALAQTALRTAAQAILGPVPGDLPAEFIVPVTAAMRQAVDGDRAGSDAALDTFVAKLPPDHRPGVLATLRQQRDAFLLDRLKAGDHFQGQQRDFETVLRSPPAEREAFARGYLFDLEPATDDRPFFFDYFRLSKFVDYWKRKGDWKDEYHPEFPVGHMVLFSALAQIAVLAFLFILLPLRRLRRQGVPTPHRFRTFMYFGALGIGFMFIEIALMQKFTLFLGHPTYSLSVVLSGMLAFSGLGALASTRLPPSRTVLLRLLGGLLVLMLAGSLTLDRILPPLLGLALGLRIAVTIALLAPLAFLLGLPFPLGIRLLEAHAPALIPWGWAINGFLSVFASIAAIVLAMQVGFTGVLLAAAAIYAAGLLLAPLARPPKTSA